MATDFTYEFKKTLIDKSPKQTDIEDIRFLSLYRFGGNVSKIREVIFLDLLVDSIELSEYATSYLQRRFSISPEITLIKKDKYLHRVIDQRGLIVRKLGLLDAANQTLVGLSPKMVTASGRAAIEVISGAFLASGTLALRSRQCIFSISCPSAEAYQGMIAVFRNTGLNLSFSQYKAKNTLVIKGKNDLILLIDNLLQEGHNSSIFTSDTPADVLSNSSSKNEPTWLKELLSQIKLVNLKNKDNGLNGNTQKSNYAAMITCARVTRAFEILGTDIPEKLYQAGKLRLAYPKASLEELGKLSNPTLSKDAIAGRIRRLLVQADTVAKEEGIADTYSAID